jgi:hypothetical protein
MTKTVLLGDEQLRLSNFNVFKATEAIGLVGQIMAAYPGLIEEARAYRERNPGALEEEAFAAIFPALYALARGNVLNLLALLCTSNDKLEEADLAGLPIHRPAEGTEWATRDGYRAIVHAGEIQQLGTLIFAAKDVLTEQLRDADPQTRAMVDAISARLPKLNATTPDASAPASSPASAKPSHGAATSSSTASRGRRRSTSAAS